MSADRVNGKSARARIREAMTVGMSKAERKAFRVEARKTRERAKARARGEV